MSIIMNSNTEDLIIKLINDSLKDYQHMYIISDPGDEQEFIFSNENQMK